MRMPLGRFWFVLFVLCLGLAGIGAGAVLLNDAQRPPLAEPGPIDITGEPSIFLFENAKGNPVGLADFRGKAILLNVWATWCAPCRKEMPALDRLQAELGGPDFEVVALSVDRNGLDAVRPFFAEIGIENLDIYLDQPAAAMKALGVVGLPTTLLIDGNGRELQRWLGPKEWDSPELVGEIRDHLGPAEAPLRSNAAWQR